MYEKLLGPAGCIYLYIDEAFGTEQYDLIGKRQMRHSMNLPLSPKQLHSNMAMNSIIPFALKNLDYKMIVIAITKTQRR